MLAAAAAAAAAVALCCLVAFGAAPVVAAADTPRTTLCASPQFVEAPMSLTVNAGQSVRFSAGAPSACSRPSTQIGTSEWQVSTNRGATWSAVPNSAATVLSTGHWGASLTVPDVKASMNGFEYRAVCLCGSGGAAAGALGPATLTVVSPVVTTKAQRARKLAAAEKACKRFHKARKRSACLASARKRYGRRA
jgi:hypothetical protein